MTFEATTGFQRHIESCYQEAGYRLVEVPQAPIADRAAFILDFLRL